MEQVHLSQFFTTKSQANDFLTRLNSFSESVYHTDFSLEKAATQYFGMKKGEAFLKLLQEQNIADSPGAIKEFIATLQQTIKTLPLLTITIAFEPNEKILHSLAEWFIMNLKKQFLLEINIDPTIIAGAVIRYKGTFLDVSSKPLVAKIMQEAFAPQEQDTSNSEIRQTAEHFHMGR